MDVELLDARELARRMSISVRTLWRLSGEGKLPQPIRLGGRIVRWRAADIEGYLEGLRK